MTAAIQFDLADAPRVGSAAARNFDWSKAAAKGVDLILLIAIVGLSARTFALAMAPLPEIETTASRSEAQAANPFSPTTSNAIP